MLSPTCNSLPGLALPPLALALASLPSLPFPVTHYLALFDPARHISNVKSSNLLLPLPPLIRFRTVAHAVPTPRRYKASLDQHQQYRRDRLNLRPEYMPIPQLLKLSDTTSSHRSVLYIPRRALLYLQSVRSTDATISTLPSFSIES